MTNKNFGLFEELDSLLRWSFCTKALWLIQPTVCFFFSFSVGCSHGQYFKIQPSNFCTMVVMVLNRCTSKDSQISSRPLDVFFFNCIFDYMLCQLPTSKRNNFSNYGWGREIRNLNFLRFSLWWKEDIKKSSGWNFKGVVWNFKRVAWNCFAKTLEGGSQIDIWLNPVA